MTSLTVFPSHALALSLTFSVSLRQKNTLFSPSCSVKETSWTDSNRHTWKSNFLILVQWPEMKSVTPDPLTYILLLYSETQVKGHFLSPAIIHWPTTLLGIPDQLLINTNSDSCHFTALKERNLQGASRATVHYLAQKKTSTHRHFW